MIAWPTSEIAVMSGDAASKVLLQIEEAKLKKSGEKITNEKKEKLLNKIQNKYNQQTSPYYAAARLWTDAIINPLETRKWISMGIEMANHKPVKERYNVGAIQT